MRSLTADFLPGKNVEFDRKMLGNMEQASSSTHALEQIAGFYP
jgi:hypothetical protein